MMTMQQFDTESYRGSFRDDLAGIHEEEVYNENTGEGLGKSKYEAAAEERDQLEAEIREMEALVAKARKRQMDKRARRAARKARAAIFGGSGRKSSSAGGNGNPAAQYFGASGHSFDAMSVGSRSSRGSKSRTSATSSTASRLEAMRLQEEIRKMEEAIAQAKKLQGIPIEEDPIPFEIHTTPDDENANKNRRSLKEARGSTRSIETYGYDRDHSDSHALNDSYGNLEDAQYDVYEEERKKRLQEEIDAMQSQIADVSNQKLQNKGLHKDLHQHNTEQKTGRRSSIGNASKHLPYLQEKKKIKKKESFGEEQNQEVQEELPRENLGGQHRRRMSKTSVGSQSILSSASSNLEAQRLEDEIRKMEEAIAAVKLAKGVPVEAEPPVSAEREIPPPVSAEREIPPPVSREREIPPPVSSANEDYVDYTGGEQQDEVADTTTTDGVPASTGFLDAITKAAKNREDRIESNGGDLVTKEIEPVKVDANAKVDADGDGDDDDAEADEDIYRPPPQLGFDLTAAVANKAQEREQRLADGGEKKMTKIKPREEYKQDFNTVVIDAASVGRLTRLPEHTIEAVAKEKTPEEEWKSNGLLAIQYKNVYRNIILEAAALGAEIKEREDVYINYEEEEDLYYEENPFNAYVQNRIRAANESRGGRSGADKIDEMLKQLKEERREEEEERGRNIVKHKDAYTNIDDVKLPCARTPKIDPEAARRRNEKKLDLTDRPLSDISKMVAAVAWERRMKLDRPGYKPKMRNPCQCPFCLTSTPMQTHAFRVLQKREKESGTMQPQQIEAEERMLADKKKKPRGGTVYKPREYKKILDPLYEPPKQMKPSYLSNKQPKKWTPTKPPPQAKPVAKPPPVSWPPPEKPLEIETLEGLPVPPQTDTREIEPPKPKTKSRQIEPPKTKIEPPQTEPPKTKIEPPQWHTEPLQYGARDFEPPEIEQVQPQTETLQSGSREIEPPEIEQSQSEPPEIEPPLSIPEMIEIETIQRDRSERDRASLNHLRELRAVHHIKETKPEPESPPVEPPTTDEEPNVTTTVSNDDPIVEGPDEDQPGETKDDSDKVEAKEIEVEPSSDLPKPASMRLKEELPKPPSKRNIEGIEEQKENLKEPEQRKEPTKVIKKKKASQPVPKTVNIKKETHTKITTTVTVEKPLITRKITTVKYIEPRGSRVTTVKVLEPEHAACACSIL